MKLRISRQSQTLSTSSQKQSEPPKGVQFILRRELPLNLITQLNPEKPDDVPIAVTDYLQTLWSTDEKADDVRDFFELNGWQYATRFTSIHVYGQNEDVPCGASQGRYGEPFLLHNSKVIKDIVLACEDDVQNAASGKHVRKFRFLRPDESDDQRIAILCEMLSKKERDRPPEIRLLRQIKRADIERWLPK
jgi:hypothetical protein